MVTKLETRTATLALALLLGTLMACKMFKKDEEQELPPVPSASAAAVASQPPPSEAAPSKPAEPELKLGDVKRFKDKEKEAEGVVKVLEADVKVFNEPDNKTPHVAELNKNIFVSRLATLDDFVLVEFPSGVGELSPGWVEAKFLSDPDAKVGEDKVKAQASAVKLVADKKEGDTKAKADEKTEAKADDTKADEKTEAKADTKADEKTEAKADDTKADEKTEAKADDTKEPTKTTEKDATAVKQVKRKKF